MYFLYLAWSLEAPVLNRRVAAARGTLGFSSRAGAQTGPPNQGKPKNNTAAKASLVVFHFVLRTARFSDEEIKNKLERRHFPKTFFQMMSKAQEKDQADNSLSR